MNHNPPDVLSLALRPVRSELSFIYNMPETNFSAPRSPCLGRVPRFLFHFQSGPSLVFLPLPKLSQPLFARLCLILSFLLSLTASWVSPRVRAPAMHVSVLELPNIGI